MALQKKVHRSCDSAEESDTVAASEEMAVSHAVADARALTFFGHGLAGQEDSPRPAPLIEIGYWRDPRDLTDSRPHPSLLVDAKWGKTVVARAVLLYVRSGFLESFELGYSFCRLECRKRDSASSGSRVMGCCTLTDGKYVWPEGFAHYISRHSVRPPDEFVEHAIRNLKMLRRAQARGRLRWDPEKRNTIPLEPGTAVFLRDRTTMGIALPPEPEIRGAASFDGVCSCMQS